MDTARINVKNFTRKISFEEDSTHFKILLECYGLTFRKTDAEGGQSDFSLPPKLMGNDVF